MKLEDGVGEQGMEDRKLFVPGLNHMVTCGAYGLYVATEHRNGQFAVFQREADTYRVRLLKPVPGPIDMRFVVTRIVVQTQRGESRRVEIFEGRLNASELRLFFTELSKFYGPAHACRLDATDLIGMGLLEVSNKQASVPPGRA